MSFTVESAFDFLKYPISIKNSLVEYYSAPHRKYHNLDHLNNVLRWVDHEYLMLIPLLESILFHDAFYASVWTPPCFNEAMSIALFTTAKLKMANFTDLRLVGDIVEVVQTINATAHHDKDQTALTELAQLMLDLDLQSFAQPREEFLRDCHNVKLEFLPMVGEKAFLKGNKKFLQTLLKRKNIYYKMKDWEKAARINLEWRIENMKAEP